ncbi:hypothetical protein [Alloyangia pacifica]|uniref:hypothetical protein n=1 Tax=Alloyangia pacifica TaxID=311180 RepID=UPI001CFEA113|nr:hypothetical protein [Alloyangia pacifica]
MGSLRWALEDLDGPRIVVFEVGGQIDLTSQIEINGDVTVAGQTAPGGITVTGARLRVVESNVIIRGINARPGDDPDGMNPDDRDGISIGKAGNTVENVILDSNSISWSIDENVATWGSPSNITISNNIVAEALKESLHSKGEHSMGMLIGDHSSNVSIIGNLLVSNKFRNALVKDDAKNIEFINNVIYNYGNEGLLVAGKSTVHVIGNFFIKGEDSSGREAIRFISNTGEAAYYVSDNVGDVGGENTSQIESSFVFDPATTEVMSSSEALDWILENVGARINGELSAIDQRIIDTVINDTGSLIDSPSDVGGYGNLQGSAALKDSDGDGIPDQYEKIIGSNASVSDANKDADGDGYTNIEDYINGLLDGFDESTGGGSEIIESPDETTDSGNTGAGVGTVLTVEAEDLVLTEGWATKSLTGSSGGKVIQNESGSLQSASLAFDGDAGVYSLTANYYDENDGVSTLAVLVNGEQVATWDWDKELGSALANKTTLTSKVIEGLELSKGDVVTLQGQHDGSEPLRIDTVSLEMTGESTDVTGPETGTDTGSETDTGTETGTGTGDIGAIGTVISVEAEALQLTEGWAVKSLAGASGGKVIQNESGSLQDASLTFDGDAGVYSLAVDYYDENDGVSALAVLVNGEQVATWDWDKELGSALANHTTLTSQVIEGLELSTGDVVTLQGQHDAREPLRIDTVSLEMTGLSDGSGDGSGSTSTEQAPENSAEWLWMEAESFEFDASANKGFQVGSIVAASGGKVLNAIGDAEATATFDGASGTYDIGVDHFDENDGVSYLEVRVNGEVVDSWLWDAELGDRLANDNTLTRHLISDVEIESGDEIMLAGYGDGGSEPLRIDALEFMPSDTLLG